MSRTIGFIIAVLLGLTVLVAPTTASAKELPSTGSSKIADQSASVGSNGLLRPGVSYKRVRVSKWSDRKWTVTNNAYNGKGDTNAYIRRGHKATNKIKRIHSVLVPAGCDLWLNGAKFWQNNGPEHDWFNIGKYPWLKVKIKLVC